MTVIPGETAEPASESPRVRSRDSIEAVALGNPLVRQAQDSSMPKFEACSIREKREKVESEE